MICYLFKQIKDSKYVRYWRRRLFQWIPASKRVWLQSAAHMSPRLMDKPITTEISWGILYLLAICLSAFEEPKANTLKAVTSSILRNINVAAKIVYLNGAYF